MKKIIFALSFLIVLASIPLFVIAQWTDNSIKATKIVRTSMNDSDTVFVMVNDNIYHKEKCPLLAGGITGMPLSSAKARGFKPCPKCLEEKSVTTASIPGYEWNFSLVQPIQSKALSYSDNSIDVSFIISKTQIAFSIQNKTDSGIKINWDDLSFVSPTGRASRIIHSGIRLIDRNNPQAPTTIPPKSRITDVAIPSENIQYVNNNWQEGLLFDGYSLSFNGREFSIYFPLEIKGTKKEYSFKFKIDVAQLSAEDIK